MLSLKKIAKHMTNIRSLTNSTRAATNESSEIFRGSSNIDLAPEGIKDAKRVAARTAGQFTAIHSSPLRRAKDTADIVSRVNRKAGAVKVESALEPWFLGEHEGQPVTPDRLKDIEDRVRNRPNEAVPGRGPKSTGEGESFNSFKNPFLNHVKSQIRQHEPGQKTLNVTHYRDIHLLKSWLMNGAPSDNSIDEDHMVSKGDSSEKPGNLFHLDPHNMKLSKVEHASKEGIYFLRHGATAWNEGHTGPSPNTGVARSSLRKIAEKGYQA